MSDKMPRKGAVESTLECPLVSIFLNGLILGGCNPVLALLSAYGWILHESGPYPILMCLHKPSLIGCQR